MTTVRTLPYLHNWVAGFDTTKIIQNIQTVRGFSRDKVEFLVTLELELIILDIILERASLLQRAKILWRRCYNLRWKMGFKVLCTLCGTELPNHIEGCFKDGEVFRKIAKNTIPRFSNGNTS